LKNYVILDCETTIKNKGSPFTKSNKLCLVGLEDKDSHHEYDIEYSGTPYGDHLRDLSSRIRGADLLIGFNIKFDLHWIRRYIPDVRIPRIYDCQLAEFILGNQGQSYPSLDKVCSDRGLGNKYDMVRVEYWENGIDTSDIPKQILSEYLRQDVMLTRKLFDQQRMELKGNQKQLFILQCEDLLILEEMEWNGMLYDKEKAKRLGLWTKDKILTIDRRLSELVDDSDINFSSDDHISCLLYGGSISIPTRETYIRVLKNGSEKERERWAYRDSTFPQLVKPLRGTETKPTNSIVGEEELKRANEARLLNGKRPFQRHFSVAEPILRQLKCTGKARKIIDLMLERSKLVKLDSTYYTGLLNKFDINEWEDDKLHGQFNQCVAKTGRLSSSSPNLQNFSGEIKELFYSRFV